MVQGKINIKDYEGIIQIKIKIINHRGHEGREEKSPINSNY